jgi:signal transduction histidine kinase
MKNSALIQNLLKSAVVILGLCLIVACSDSSDSGTNTPVEPVESVDPVDANIIAIESGENFETDLKTALIEAEQRFTANAAHELMTPLAAIKAEVQLCQRLLRDEQGTAMLQRISQRVDRASHSVEQLLILARLDPDTRVASSPVQLRALLVEVLADTAHLAADRQLEIALVDGEDCQVSGNKEALASACLL